MFDDGRFDRTLIYAKFQSAISQSCEPQQLIPFALDGAAGSDAADADDSALRV